MSKRQSSLLAGKATILRRAHFWSPCRLLSFSQPDIRVNKNNNVLGKPGYARAKDTPRHHRLARRPAPVHRHLEAFLNAGPAPLVFTLGSVVVHAAGRFYVQAAQTAARLGMRAVLLTGQPDGGMCSSGDILVRAYAPHSALFPRAAVIIHHGVVGTTRGIKRKPRASAPSCKPRPGRKPQHLRLRRLSPGMAEIGRASCRERV